MKSPFLFYFSIFYSIFQKEKIKTFSENKESVLRNYFVKFKKEKQRIEAMATPRPAQGTL